MKTRKDPVTPEAAEAHRKYNREWARAHYVPIPRPTLQERLWARVDKTETCWLWTGHLGAGGRYGAIRDSAPGRKTRIAHRLTWEWANGPVPEGLELDHLCRNTRCVRPDHLEPVTHAENMRRGVGFAGVNSRKTHCARHNEPLVSIGETRGCRRCRIEDKTAYRRRIGVVTREEAQQRAWAGRSPERRAEISRRIWETRRRNAAA